MSWPAGVELRVQTAELTLRGEFVSADNTELRLKIQKDTAVTVGRSRVVKVERRIPGSNRAQNASYGLAAGFVVGLARMPLQCGQCPPNALLLLAPLPMLLGTVIGASRPAERWEVIYEQK